MKVVQINGGVFGSTGKIMFGIADALNQCGGQCLCFAPVTSTNHFQEPEHYYIKISSYYLRRFSVLLDRITGGQGRGAVFATKKLIRDIKCYDPDVIHLQNIHGGFVNIPRLFNYLKKCRKSIVWTFHDCWPYTGHCTYYDIVGCEKWKTECCQCPLFSEYPKCIWDNSKYLYKKKKAWFGGIHDLTIVTPSQWLADLVRQSFLSDYPVKIINNGIDLSVFKPTPSSFREKYGIPNNKFILLGVAFDWGVRKGLDIFVELAKRLPQEQYQIVLVGTNEKVDKQLPDNIISVHRTQNQQELAEIYTAADLFVNPTREENYPTVNMESIACGTPVLTFKTGGCSEIVNDTCGSIVEKDDVNAMEREIVRICTDNPYSVENCLNRAKVFDTRDRFQEYINLYKEI